MSVLADMVFDRNARIAELEEAVRVLAAEVNRCHNIARKYKHHDMSCSLEAQGYDQIDCAVIGAVDGFSAEIIEPNPPRGTESPIKTLMANPIAAEAVRKAGG